jgi:hypothetical protein
MRFIKGREFEEAIAACRKGRWSDDSSEPVPTLNDLVRHMIAVCNAVSYAHTRASSTATSSRGTS